MSDICIICEANPIHNGHKYLIDSARNQGAERIICIMSGNSVQRGELAITDKYLRAEALLKCGADLVIELPFPWCCASAEAFATAGVHIADRFGDAIIFGSECGNIDILNKAATAASDNDFRNEYKSKLSEGYRAATAYHDMLKSKTGIDLSSNDLLGVEYIRASIKLQSKLNFFTIARCGDMYLDDIITDDKYPSATAIRNMWKNGKFEETQKYIPSDAFDVYSNAFKNDSIITDISELDSAVLWFFRSRNGEDLCNIVGAEGGLANRFCEKAKVATSVSELVELVKNKRYTDSHLRRFMLYCMIGVTSDDISALPDETFLLAANEKGRKLLTEKRKHGVLDDFYLITKPADQNMDKRQNILSSRVDALFSLARKKKLPSDFCIKNKPYIE